MQRFECAYGALSVREYYEDRFPSIDTSRNRLNAHQYNDHREMMEKH